VEVARAHWRYHASCDILDSPNFQLNWCKIYESYPQTTFRC
jgi:hypothetical protein